MTYYLHTTETMYQDCVYWSKASGEYEITQNCFSRDNNKMVLKQTVLDDLAYDEKALSCIYHDRGRTSYIHKNGTIREVFYYDNGCDYFQNGLARAYVDGQKVYIDEKLNIVLKTDFEVITPFYYQHAVVCNDDSKGGQCGLIDQRGQLVVDVKYTINSHDIFMDYINSHNHCPKPPIMTKESAVCHAKRHHDEDFFKAMTIDRDTKSEVSKVQDEWVVTFDDKNESRTWVIDAQKAGFIFSSFSSHKRVVQERVNDQ